jgi:hypothetical protein
VDQGSPVQAKLIAADYLRAFGELLEQVDLDAVRVVGNFAAHPIKSTNTGEVVDVEPGEAEWVIEVIESLFDFYFTLPVKAEERRKALNAKLEEAGKPELKIASD